MSAAIKLKPLLVTPEPPELGPGPRAGVQTADSLSRALEGLFSNSPVPVQRQELLRALLLLWHDHLDAAHEIAQHIPDPDGAFVHGIMHRREPDYGNAKYWFRRVGKHRAFAELARRAAPLLENEPARKLQAQLLPGGEWDAFAFVDACERAARKPNGLAQQLRELQRVETEVLLDCFCDF
jgi:hypothetical protein